MDKRLKDLVLQFYSGIIITNEALTELLKERRFRLQDKQKATNALNFFSKYEKNMWTACKANPDDEQELVDRLDLFTGMINSMTGLDEARIIMIHHICEMSHADLIDAEKCTIDFKDVILSHKKEVIIQILLKHLSMINPEDVEDYRLIHDNKKYKIHAIKNGVFTLKNKNEELVLVQDDLDINELRKFNNHIYDEVLPKKHKVDSADSEDGNLPAG